MGVDPPPPPDAGRHTPKKNRPLPPLQAAQHPNDKRGYINEVLNHVGPRSEPMLTAWGLKLSGMNGG